MGEPVCFFYPKSRWEAMAMDFTLGILVDNEAGVLARVASLFSRRGYNIQSLAVGPTDDPGTSWITLRAEGEDAVRVQMQRQLGKLVEVVGVYHMTEGSSVERELALIKVRTDTGRRAEGMQIAQTFRAGVIDVNPSSVVLETTGDSGKVNALIDVMREFGVLEVARTGAVAMLRGPGVLREDPEDGRSPPDELPQAQVR